MIRSGIAPLDERLGGFMPGRAYVLSGAPGTGKSVACLEFIHRAIEDGEAAAILTQDDPTDILAQARFLGIELERPLAEERLILLRYQLDFSRRFSRASSPEVAFEELAKLLGPRKPARLAIDSVSPFVEGGTASGNGLTAMLQFLDQLGTTSILTYPGDLAGRYDRRLDALVQRAGAIVHLTCEPDRSGRMDIRKIRYTVPSTAPISFRIKPGAGIVPVVEGLQRRADDVPEETRRRVLVLDSTQDFPTELLGVLNSKYDVSVRAGVASAFSDLALSSTGAVILDVRRDTVDDALALVRELRRGGNRAPIVLVTRYTLRSDDRARALRAGADEFLSGDMRPEEFLLRIEAVLRRGRSTAVPADDVEVPIVSQPSNGNGLEPFDENGFRAAVQAHMTRDDIPFFTVATVRPQDGDVGRLAMLAVKTMRAEGGDLAGLLDGRVAVYLHSARRKDVLPYVERLREGWRRDGLGELEVDTVSYPADDQQVRALIGAPE